MAMSFILQMPMGRRNRRRVARESTLVGGSEKEDSSGVRVLVSALLLLRMLYANICVLKGDFCRHSDIAACSTPLVGRFKPVCIPRHPRVRYPPLGPYSTDANCIGALVSPMGKARVRQRDDTGYDIPFRTEDRSSCSVLPTRIPPSIAQVRFTSLALGALSCLPASVFR